MAIERAGVDLAPSNRKPRTTRGEYFNRFRCVVLGDYYCIDSFKSLAEFFTINLEIFI